jgi:hypothetical protein
MEWDYIAMRVINFLRSVTMRTMPPEEEVRRLRKATRFMYGVFSAFYPIAVLILVLLSTMGAIPVPSTGSASLPESEVVLSGFSILFLAVGFFWPWLARWHKKAYVADMELLYGHGVRAIFLAPPVGCGSILRILGSSWYIVLPIFILGFAALVLTFPTDRRLAKWQRGQKPSR